MKVKEEFEDGEENIIEIVHDGEGRLNHVAHYPLKNGPRTYKSLHIFSVPEKDENQYIVSFWKLRKKEGLLEKDEETEFKCEKNEVTRLLGFLDNLYELEGLERGDHVILKKNSPSAEAAASAIEAVKSCENGVVRDILLELIGSLDELEVDLDELDLSSEAVEQRAIKAEHAIKHARTKAILDEFKEKISSREDEDEYQEYLEENPWLFGQEYVKKLEIREITRNEEVDFCFESVDGFYDIVEIKKPQTRILVEDGSHDTHRASSQLSSAIAQLENYIYRIEQSQGTIAMRDDLKMVKPRGKIVLGDELSSDERESLRVMNSHLNRITIYTFSDIAEIGQRVVDRYEQHEDLPTEEISLTEEE